MSRAWPTRHEQAVLRRIARGNLCIELRDGQPAPVFSYENGDTILTANSTELDETGFARLAKWLIPDPDDIPIEDGVAQIWRVRSAQPEPESEPASDRLTTLKR